MNDTVYIIPTTDDDDMDTPYLTLLAHRHHATVTIVSIIPGATEARHMTFTAGRARQLYSYLGDLLKHMP